MRLSIFFDTNLIIKNVFIGVSLGIETANVYVMVWYPNF